MTGHRRQNDTEDSENISLTKTYLHIKYETFFRLIIELIIITGMGIGIYFSLRFSYIETRINENSKAIIELDKSKIGIEDYDRWERIKKELKPGALIWEKLKKGEEVYNGNYTT